MEANGRRLVSVTPLAFLGVGRNCELSTVNRECELDVEAVEDHVAVLDHIVLALDPDLPG